MTGRYAVFLGETYYPAGGWDDCAGIFRTTKAAGDYIKLRAEAPFSMIDWWQVVDLSTGHMIVCHKRNDEKNNYYPEELT